MSARHDRNMLSRRQHARAVDRHLGVGVEPLEHDLDVVAPQQRGVGVDRGPVLPVGVLDPLQLLLVRADERIGDLPGAQEIGVDAARNDRRDPVAEPGRPAHRPQLPAAERERQRLARLRRRPGPRRRRRRRRRRPPRSQGRQPPPGSPARSGFVDDDGDVEVLPSRRRVQARSCPDCRGRWPGRSRPGGTRPRRRPPPRRAATPRPCAPLASGCGGVPYRFEEKMIQ